MRTYYLPCSILPLLMLALFSTGSKDAFAEPILLHHDLQILLHPAEHSLSVRDVMTVSPSDGDVLEFKISPSAKIGTVRVEGRPADFEFRQGDVAIDIRPYRRQTEFRLEVTYKAVFDDPVPGNPVHSEDPSYGVSGTISPDGVFLGGGTGWHPLQPGVSATFNFSIRVPGNWAAVTAGKFLGAKDMGNGRQVDWDLTEPLETLSLAAGPYLLDTGKAGETPVYAFFFPAEADLSSAYLKAAEKYLLFYQELLGPYPFAKFAVVENFFPTGYGFPSWTLLGSTVIRLPFILDTSLPHEIVHSWWGNGVLVDFDRGNWSEGLTTYLSDYYLKELASPEQGREYRLKILRDYASLVPPGEGIPLNRFVSRNSAAGQAIGYGKAAMVFHMLRRDIGDPAFWEGLRKVARERMFRQTSWDDFRRAFEEGSSGNLARFFQQWIDRSGAPSLSLQNVRLSGKGEAWEITGILDQSAAPPYSFTFPLRLETSGGSSETLLPVRDRQTSFRLTSAERPLILKGDPDCHLFRRLDATELPPTVNGIRGSSSLLVIKSDDFSEGLLPAARLLLAALRQDSARMVREKDVSAADMRGDILFLGLPVRQDLRPAIPPALDISPDSAQFEGHTYADEGTALFAALPHPRNPGNSAALFLPLSLDGGLAAARKIPHYGKYSYLIFEKGVNRVKGTWEPAASPLLIAFPSQENNP